MPQIAGKQLKNNTVTSTQTLTGAATASIEAGDVAAEGSSTKLAREDHQHAIDTTNGAIATVNAGDAAVEGSGTGVSRRDHQHAVSTGAATAQIDVGDSAAEGSSANLAREDHQHALPAPSAPADVTKSAASAGVATTVARADHKHDISTAAPSDVGVANSEGTATSMARSDHIHAIGASAKSDVLDSKLFAFGVQTLDYTAGSSTSDVGNAITKEVSDGSLSKKIGGGNSVAGIVTSGVENKVSLRDATTNDPIQDGSSRQVYARITAGTTAQGGTWTWQGTTTVLATDTSGVVVGNFIRNAADGQMFEISAITANTDVTILNPGSLTIPSASGADKVELTISYYVDISGTETAHTMGGESLDLVFRESLGLDQAPFGALQTGAAFTEVLPAGHLHTLTDVSDVTASAAEVNTLNGFTGTTAELNEITDGSDVAAATHHHDSAYINETALTTKGDILVRDATSAIREPVGTNGQVLTADSTQASGIKWAAAASTDTEQQEEITTQNIAGTDTAITDTLNSTPKSVASLILVLNGVVQHQGAGKDYTISGSTITWLASTGTAVDLETTDTLTATYVS